MRLVQLTMVTGEDHSHNDELPPIEGSGEDDGLTEATPPPPTPIEKTTPVMVDAERIRCFYSRKPRRDGTERRGTRLTFENGAGMAVTELFEEVAAKLGRVN